MRKEKVVVSIVMPYYKKKKYFQKTLNSILNQSYKKYELIIIYDDENKNDLRFIKKQIKKNKKIKSLLIRKILVQVFQEIRVLVIAREVTLLF